jgi:glycosyltransferase involved in cell wall biosynthesis
MAMAHDSRSLVSIGVPVYNGETGIARALDGLLRQDYANLEIVISDNGSSDRTPDICREYAARDGRIRYHRSDENHGSSWNFNRVLDLSTGEYFMWAAHDDLREPSFVSACVARLDAEPDAVLCQARTAMFVDGRRELLCTAHLGSFHGISDLVGRYRETLSRFPATAFYGVYRAAAVRKTRVFQQQIATDVAFIQELSIHGRFVEVPELLFHYFGREHWNTIDQDYRAIFGVDRKPWWYLPFVVLFWSHCTRVSGTPIPGSMKLRLWYVLVAHEIRQSCIKVMVKAGRACPRRWQLRLGQAIYWKWIHSPNVEVGSTELFTERVIKPKLGWWR